MEPTERTDRGADAANLAYVTLRGYVRDVIFGGDSAPWFGGAYAADAGLRDAFMARGVECHTPDMLPLDRFDGFFFRDMPPETDPAFRYAKAHGKPMFLHVWENPYIHRPNADWKRFRDFRKVFSFSDDDVRMRGCVRLDYAHPLAPPPENAIPFGRRRFACMVSSLVKKNRPHCCSYLRLKTIRFYESSHPEMFDLWGAGWDKGSKPFQDSPGLYGFLSACQIHRLLPRVRHASWRGECGDKIETMGAYKFAYCYENSTGLPGYVTEKLFDALSSGAVPVYIAHPDDKAKLHPDCFIDRARFRNDADLFGFLSSMTEDRWNGFRAAGLEFLKSQDAARFSFGAYANTLVREIAPLLPGGEKETSPA